MLEIAQNAAEGAAGKKLDEVPLNPAEIVGGLMILVTALGMIAAFLNRWSMGCLCAFVTPVLLFILAIILIVFGAIFLVPAAAGSTDI